MSGNRQRLRPWLVAKIDSREIPGLHWMNQEKTIFRIPWKHGGKQDWSPEHSQIFMEWAKHTGKYREGLDNPEWAKWKTRLRCAFNKAPDIVELKEKSDTDATNPFKVYMFKEVEKNHRGSRVKKEEATVRPAAAVSQEPMLPGVLDSFNRSNTSSELASLPEDLRGIRSLELVQGAGNADISMVSAGSLPSFSNQPGVESMEIKDEVAVDPNLFPTNAANGAPITVPSQPPLLPTSSSPLLGSTAVTLPYTHALTSPAASDVTFELAASPAMSDASGASAQTLYAPGSVSSALSPAATSPLQGDLPCLLPPQVTPVELDSCSPPNSVELPDTAQLTLLNIQDVKIQELPNHLISAPGIITLVYGDDGETKVILREETMMPEIVHGKEMHVRVEYLNAVVLEEWVTGDDGCRLYYGSDSDIRALATKEVARKMLGPPEALQLHLPPSTNLIKNPKQEEYTQMLLENVKRGILLECLNGDVYATRYCKCVVYYCNETEQTGIKLVRHQKTKVFDFNMFLTAFRIYKEKGGTQPSPEACLSFGQQSHYKNLAQSTLISTFILSARAFNMLQGGGTSTISSTSELEDDMQVSDSDDMDRQMDYFSFSNL